MTLYFPLHQMPRPPQYDRDEVIQVFTTARDRIIYDEKIVGPTDPVWADLSKQLGGTVKPKTLYTIVKLNRHDSWKILGIHSENNGSDESTDEVQEIQSNENVENDLEAESVDSSDEKKHTGIRNEIDIKLEITHQEWNDDWVEHVMYNDSFQSSQKREHLVLKRGVWTHSLNKKIWEASKCPCTIAFKRGKIYPNGILKCLDIIGVCTECNAQISIYSQNLPKDSASMVLHCEIKKIAQHNQKGKKRKLSGTYRNQVSEELWDGRKVSHVWRTAAANEMMDLNDPEPSHLPSLTVLRKAKHEKGLKELGHAHPVISLQTMKYSVPYNGSIFDIGLDKFFCHYHTPSQLQVYKTMSKTKGSTVSFDATGTVVRKLQRETGPSGHIFLYQGVLSSPGMHIPIVQMLSERHDIGAIATWLTDWKRSGAAVPSEAVSDFSLALLGGLVKAFTTFPDLKSYINQCFGVLQGKESNTLPPCYIRVDVAHCVKLISRWECLRKKSNRVREFYLRAMGQLVQITSLDEARQLISQIAVVALSESEGMDEQGMPVSSETCKLAIKDLIAKGSSAEEKETKDPMASGEDEKMSQMKECQTDAQRWASEICEESRCLASSDGDRDNLHFLPDLVPHLIRMAAYLPLWTAVMVPHFKSVHITASSANVEAEFKNLKKGLFKHDNMPLRVDRFVRRHLDHIEGQMKLSSANMKIELSDEDSEETEEQEEPVENWRGLVASTKKRTSYLTPCPEWQHMDLTTKQKKTQIGLLRNGNHFASHAINTGKAQLSVVNTCAFDSFLQCLCCAYCDSPRFSRYVQGTNHPVLDLVESIVTGGINSTTYKQRALILAKMFSHDSLKSGAHQINAACNVSRIVTDTMKDVDTLTFTTSCSSPTCPRNDSRSLPLVPVNFKTLGRRGIKDLQAAIEDGLHLHPVECHQPVDNDEADSSSDVQRCDGVVTHTYASGEILFVELGTTQHIMLNQFPVNIMLQQDQFTLRGIVAFQPGTRKKGLGHYVALCRRSSRNWEEYDDLAKGVTMAKEKSTILPHVVIFTKD